MFILVKILEGGSYHLRGLSKYPAASCFVESPSYWRGVRRSLVRLFVTNQIPHGLRAQVRSHGGDKTIWYETEWLWKLISKCTTERLLNVCDLVPTIMVCVCFQYRTTPNTIMRAEYVYIVKLNWIENEIVLNICLKEQRERLIGVKEMNSLVMWELQFTIWPMHF